MSNAIKTLQRVLGQSVGAAVGVVVKATGDAVAIRTAAGLQFAVRQPGDATQYRPGDSVSVFGGYVRGRRLRSKTHVG